MTAPTTPLLELAADRPDCWERFVAAGWERQVTRFTPPPEGLGGDAELFPAVVALAEAWRDPEQVASLHLWIEKGSQDHDLGPLLPSRKDGDFEGWNQRLQETLGGKPYCLMVSGLQRFLPELYQGCRRFLAPLLERVGLPAGKVDVDGFFGHYPRSVRGVHLDSASNFFFQLHGKKQMSFWSRDCFEVGDCYLDPFHARDEPVASREAAGLHVDLAPGDVLYWPTSAWHVGASPGEFTVNLNLALYLEADPQTTLFRALSRRLPEHGWPGTLGAVASGELPERLARVEAELEGFVGAGSLRGALLEQWLQQASAGGFAQVPPPRERVELGDELRLTAEAGSLLHAREGAEVVLGGHGQVLSVSAHSAILRLAELVAAGGSWAVSELLEQVSGETTDETRAQLRPVLLDLLGELHAWRVLELSGA